MFAPDAFGKMWKWEINPVLSLLLGSHKHLALRETAQSVLETWGCMYYALPWSAQGMRKRKKKADSCTAMKGVKKLGSK